jgi:hypothetical protein
MPLAGVPLPLACHGLYVDPAMTDAQRDQARSWYTGAIDEIHAFWGADSFAANGNEPSSVVLCTSDTCETTFTGPTKRSVTKMSPRPTVYVNGFGSLTRGTIIHEMTHVVLALKQRSTGGPTLPGWLNEGTASFVGNNIACEPGMTDAIDDLRRLHTEEQWMNFTNLPGKIRPAYCQAMGEVSAWVATHSRAELAATMDAFYSGTPLEQAYGQLAVPPSSPEHVLDAELLLDEGENGVSLDSTGRAHVAALSSSSHWVEGHTGFGVQVGGGAHIRLDGLYDLGLPDMPFSLSVWTKPAAGAQVLVHSAMNESGGDGFCMPLVGQDSAGHLVAQVPFAQRSDAFLVARAPALPTDQWSQVTMTWAPSEGLSLYVNGDLVVAAPPASTEQQHRDAPAVPLRLFLGSDVGANCWRGGIPRGDWSGTIDDVRVYSYALSSAEARALAQ